MSKLVILILSTFLLSGCASIPEYNPVQSATSETFLLNEQGLKNIHIGMTRDEVHKLLGQELVIGYDYQASALKDADQPKPISIPNPYRIQDFQGCTIEYYVTAIHRPDGSVSDDELVSLTFCKGVLAGKGGASAQ